MDEVRKTRRPAAGERAATYRPPCAYNAIFRAVFEE
jgi:hypothetical protein